MGDVTAEAVEAPQAYTATTTTANMPISAPMVDVEYIKTIPGILKIVELFLGFIAWVCIASSGYCCGENFVMFVEVTAWLATILLLVVHLLTLHNKAPLSALPWPFIEFCYHAGVTLMYFIAACVVAATTGNRATVWAAWYNSTYSAASAFAFFTTIAYGIDAYLSFACWREEPPINRHMTPDPPAQPAAV
ncbi:CKLF-like MARVEL transmembrane domain-containing protein 8 [Branchiostoma lanceolatum]|uniref:CKLF-like MARVEL transmembrane domain-containing protein 8 n=1 Tax=Branchiostoma lanceolatum TaxID=7740 RepID=UPI001132B3F9